ncbi:MAG: hypothetical protein Tsb0020_28000 [Haliangiales bacterium]
MSDEHSRIDPSQAFESQLVSGGELLRQNRTADARAAFERALEVRPDDVKALALLGLACFRMGDFEGALPIYQRLVAVDRNDASYWLNLGLVHLKLGDAGAAITELERSRELDPSQSRAVSYLGLAYARTGSYAQAYQAFLQAGDLELAREMEQYLSERERERIQATLPGGGFREGESRRSQSQLFGVPLGDPPAATSPRPATGEGATDPGQAAPTELGSGEIEVIEPDDDDIEVIEADDHDDAAAPAAAPVSPTEQSAAPVEIRDSRPLVHPTGDGRRPNTEGQGVISLAVAQAVPSAAAAAGAARVAVGHTPPTPLSEFATARLIRPEDGDHSFETGAGGFLIARVKGRMFARSEGVSVTGGALRFQVASRHVRGSSTGEPFASDGRDMFAVSGEGHLIASPLGEHFSVVALDDDILYLREQSVFAFEDQLRWENGHVPGSKATLRMVQFRGTGEVAFRSKRPLVSIKLAPEHVLHVDARALSGWIGRVVPRAKIASARTGEPDMIIECTGEGVVLIEEEVDLASWSGAAVVTPADADADAEERS